MGEVRIGIIGLGNMGSGHANWLKEGKVKRCRLTAVCDLKPELASRYSGLKFFTDSAQLIRSKEVDAVLIATPHYFHTTMGIDAFSQGLHVLTEKPISVHKKDCQRLITAHTDKKLVFGAMFQTRTEPVYRKLKQLVDNGELGRITRVNWIITDWFRSEAYYASGGWRATWAGEGGGVLLNQCPHNLDLLTWILGMPSKVRATCNLGKWHNIEVEDEVTAYLEYSGGATGVFVTTTGEAPGTNRWEIAGDKGRLVVENGKINFKRNETPMLEFCRTTRESFPTLPSWNIEIPAPGHSGGHCEVTQAFVDAILDGTPLLAAGEEGIKSVELANAMLYSSLTNATVDLPLDADAYEKKLKELIAGSRFVKKTMDDVKVDMNASFKK